MRFRTRWKLYEFINKNPGLSYSQIYRKTKFCNIKKTFKYICRLVEEGLIKQKLNRLYSTPLKELIKWDEFNWEEKL